MTCDLFISLFLGELFQGAFKKALEKITYPNPTLKNEPA
jgi:hypothetical protein